MNICIKEITQILINDPPAVHEKFLKDEFYFASGDDSKIIGEPDVVINFFDENKERINAFKSPLGNDERGFYWFDFNKRKCRASFHNFSTSKFEVSVDKSFNPNFLYKIIEYIIGARSINKGGVFCHSSAVKYKDKVYLFPAWRHVGKTNILLEFLRRGAEIIADDGVILFQDGTFLPYSNRIHLLYYNLTTHPNLLDKIDESNLRLMKFLECSEGNDYKFQKNTISRLKELIRIRLPLELVTGVKYEADLIKADAIIHLTRLLDDNLSGFKVKSITSDKLSDMVSQASLFETSYFNDGYILDSVVNGSFDPTLQSSKEIVKKYLYNASKNIKILGDAFFSKCFKPAEAVNEIVKYANEKR